jgi:hypothetical protein
MTESTMDSMFWFANRWWSFPGSRIGEDSEFEWRDFRLCLLKPDGSAVAGIEVAGEVSED